MGYSPWGCKELDTTEQTAHTCLSQHPRISLDHEPKVVGGALPVKTEALSRPRIVTVLAAFDFCRTDCHQSFSSSVEVSVISQSQSHRTIRILIDLGPRA